MRFSGRSYYIGAFAGLWLATVTSFFFNEWNLVLTIAIASAGIIGLFIVSNDD